MHVSRPTHGPGAGPGGDDGRDPGRGPRRTSAREGAAALSLRSIARDLGMAPSALYRYFDGRDALLSALILAAYESLATEAERAADAAGRRCGRCGRPAEGRPATPSASLAVPRALRGWALGHPHEWGLDLRDPGAGLPGARGHRRALRPGRRRTGAPGGSGRGRGPARAGHGTRRRSPAELAAAVAPVTEGLFLPRDAGRGRWCSRSRPGRRSSASSASRCSGTGATRSSTRACSSRRHGTRPRRTPLGLGLADGVRTADRSDRTDRPESQLSASVSRSAWARCPQLLEPLLGDPLGQRRPRDRRRAPPAPPAPCWVPPA